eukprot:COSAG01_NODE_796_length_13536_cov_5.683635_14_plen_93_part_00
MSSRGPNTKQSASSSSLLTSEPRFCTAPPGSVVTARATCTARSTSVPPAITVIAASTSASCPTGAAAPVMLTVWLARTARKPSEAWSRTVSV